MLSTQNETRVSLTPTHFVDFNSTGLVLKDGATLGEPIFLKDCPIDSKIYVFGNASFNRMFGILKKVNNISLILETSYGGWNNQKPTISDSMIRLDKLCGVGMLCTIGTVVHPVDYLTHLWEYQNKRLAKGSA
jgi:hypothetical protein